ncbi:MAG: zinc ribbon domain-containing protein [Eubacteriales bacterium]|nr:zinc ribbon domain-containing protein [Eubacteriales bacterium]MDD4682736.1 zinc ribbon domain-containing protein [Eubacteriales bacterium]
MICSQCGKNNPDDARFCDGCGSPLQAAPVNQGYTAPPPPPPPQPQYQQTYQQPPQAYQNSGGYTGGADNSVLSVGQYIGMIILSAIPLVGLILLLVWAFGSDTNANKKNFARAMLIMMIIGVVLSIIFSAAIGGLIAALAGSGGYY